MYIVCAREKINLGSLSNSENLTHGITLEGVTYAWGIAVQSTLDN